MNIQTLRLEPGDVIVVSVPERISQEFADGVKQRLTEQLGDYKVVVLGAGLSLTVVHRAA